MSKVSAEQIIEYLELQPLVGEGGYYVETYRSGEVVQGLPERYSGPRSLGTLIYFLLTPTKVSKFHKLKGDEIWHFYLGDPVDHVQLKSGDSSEVIRLGHNLLNGERSHVIIPHGTWQGAKLIEGGSWALMGCTVVPGFEFEDFVVGTSEELLLSHPSSKQWIDVLT